MERYHIFRLGLAVLFYAAYCIRPMVVHGQKIDDEVHTDSQTKKINEEDLVFYQGVQGKPGVDFPVLSHIPRTSFSCRVVDSGYYADLETDCQVFHICEDNKKISFLCPNGTIFQQSELICEWWFKVNCTNSPNLYEESAEQLREDNARRKLSRRVQNHGAVMRTEERSSVTAVRNFDNKASKRVTENRINNHASTYRDDFDQNNDLSRSPSSDFVRDRNVNQPTPFQKQSRNEEVSDTVSQRGRKPVQFQHQPSVDNEDKKEDRRVVSSRKNVQRGRVRKPVDPGSVNNQEQRQRDDFSSNRNSNYDFGRQNLANENEDNSENYNGRQVDFSERKSKSFVSSQNQHVKTNQEDVSTNAFRQSTPFGSRTTESTRHTFRQPNRNGHSRRINTDFSQQFSLDNNSRKFTTTTERNTVTPTSNNNFHQSKVVNKQEQQSGTVDFHELRKQNDYQPTTNIDVTTTSYLNIDSGRQKFEKHNYDTFKQRQRFGTTNNHEIRKQNDYQPSTNTDVTTQSYSNIDSERQKFDDPNYDTFKQQPFGTANNNKIRKQNNYQPTTNTDVTTASYSNIDSNRQKFENHNYDNFNQQQQFGTVNNNEIRKQNDYHPTTSTVVTTASYSNIDSGRQRFDNHNYDNNFNSGTTKKSISNEFKVRNDVSNHGTISNADNTNLKEQNNQQGTASNNENVHKTKQSISTHNEEENISIQTTHNTNFQQSQQDFVSTGTQKPIPLSVNTNNNNNERLSNHRSYSFPNSQQEKVFSTTPQHKTNLNVDGKDGTLKQTSTASLTKNDIVNRRLEGSDSDEAQITQETASFYKNSFNRIDQNYKSTSPNPHPNHRETYSDLKEPKYYSTKIFSAISSVTPQYLTTQSINNGRPFVGSQVGTTLRGTDKNRGTTVSYFTTTTIAPTTTNNTVTTVSTETPTTPFVVPVSLFNTGRTDKSLRPIALSTLATYSPKPAAKVTIPAQGSFNLGSTSTYRPKTESSTGRVIDHATVYGKFVKSGATTPSAGKSTIVLSKSVFGGATPRPFSVSTTHKPTTSTAPSGRRIISLSKSLFNGATPKPFSKSTQEVKFPSSTAKTSAEILSASDSFNRGTPQVRFFGKVQTTTRIPGVEIHFNGNSIASLSTTAKPFSKTTKGGKTSSFNSFSTSSKPFSSSTANPLSAEIYDNFPSTISGDSTTTSSHRPSTISSFSTTFNPEFNSVTPFSFSTFNPEFNSVTPTTFYTSTINPDFNSVTPTDFNSFGTENSVNSVGTTQKPFGTTHTPQSKVSGFFVTKGVASPSTERSLIGDIIRPRPFQLPPEPDFSGKPVYTSTTTENGPTTPPSTYPTYKISSASPFSNPSTPEPTQPTPFTTPQPTLPSTFENVDSMINALAEMASHNNFSSDPRPGLVIPPSAGPQTLHTLAVYFANALDGIAAEKEEEEEEESEVEKEDEESLTKLELEKKRLTELLTQMTMDRYNELFSEENEETTTITSRIKSDDEDLEGQHSKGPAQTTPKVRQLAKVFTQALSSYLDDPATFKKVLEEVRPTEPPALENEDIDLGDDELLNFSDADSKSSFPPFFPTPPAVRPTWGYLIAYNTSQNLDVKNSINPDLENLQGADSQSFVSQLNKLHNSYKDEDESTTKSSTQLPDDHWTTSPDVGKLWKKAFSFDPASINENFGTTEATIATTEGTEEPKLSNNHHEIKYELRALPQFELNSTQVHGILIDFMNTTKKDDDNRLQRILRKLNTTEDEFLEKMKEIENNPLTRRLILLLISECGSNATEQVDTKLVPVHNLLSRTVNSTEILETSSSVGGFGVRHQEPTRNSDIAIVDPSLSEDTQDARALQLLNSLYTIASRFGK